MRVLLIDNHDSFTWNLAQLIGSLCGRDPLVVRNDELSWKQLGEVPCDAIVLSPGPGRPERPRDFGVCLEAIRFSRVPLLGVCLGQQGIAHAFGGRVVHAPEPMHGRLSAIRHDGRGLFSGLPNPFRAVRYHSLVVAAELPPELEACAWTEDSLLMGIRHRSRPLHGVQFHPESICSEQGRALLRNFLRLARPQPAVTAPRPVPTLPRAPAGEGLALQLTLLDSAVDAEQLFRSRFASCRRAFWLDSSFHSAGLSRFSFLGEGEELVPPEGEFFPFLSSRLRQLRVTGGSALPFDFHGGLVGCMSYECSEASAAGSRFLEVRRFVAIDHLEGKSYFVTAGTKETEAEDRGWREELHRVAAGLPSRWRAEPEAELRETQECAFSPRHDRESYLRLIEKCQEALRNGESYELCLTNQFFRELPGLEPLPVYLRLRRINPAPYGAFLRFGDFAVLSSSPERFLRLGREGALDSKPIKGTAPRGSSPAEDQALAAGLQASEKNRSENLMIVDLLRNDLGRVCETDSVEVPRLMSIESYANVHQLVSTVQGRLRPGLSALDAVHALFPGGSMTGAPKERSMELLRALEGGPRGIYSGALGFLSGNGCAELSIVIRTILKEGDRFSIGAGGAIVALSTAQDEWEELLLKARAPLRAVREALGSLHSAEKSAKDC